ncbi:MAG: hypothetical protein OJF50_006420 [Nitrospira sp.]|nr:hypothetical protein [Nitrospira sp.]
MRGLAAPTLHGAPSYRYRLEIVRGRATVRHAVLSFREIGYADQ